MLPYRPAADSSLATARIRAIHRGQWMLFEDRGKPAGDLTDPA